MRWLQRHDAINLSQGFPDFDGPPELLQRVQHYLTNGFNQYPPMAGVVPLRQAIAEKVADLYGLQCSVDDEITVTAGATEALFCAIAAVVHQGDEVIVFDPCYDSYDPVIRLQVVYRCTFLWWRRTTAWTGIKWRTPLPTILG